VHQLPRGRQLEVLPDGRNVDTSSWTGLVMTEFRTICRRFSRLVQPGASVRRSSGSSPRAGR